jgi:hypothetical protein
MPIVFSLFYANFPIQLYSRNRSEFWLPTHISELEMSPVTLTIAFNKPDLSSDDFYISVVAKFVANTTSIPATSTPPNILLARLAKVPALGDLSMVLQSTSTLDSTVSSINKGKLTGWNATIVTSGHLETFTPYSFPTDYYSTDRLYLGVDKRFDVRFIGLSLSERIPAGFDAFFDNASTLTFDHLPSRLQGTIVNPSNYTYFSFGVAMARSRPNLIFSLIYTVFPILSLYELCALTLISVRKRKDRLAIYVGASFTVFAYLLSIRQYTPPSPTIIESGVSAGLLLWIMIEMVRFLRQKPSQSPIPQTNEKPHQRHLILS